jgi:ABC-type branched-subunit amino acid transport system ATPase component
MRNLTVRYGAVSAVSDVSFDVPEGAIVGLIGPNGAGKTSLIDAVTGFASYKGTVSLDGRPLEGLRPHQRTRAGLGRTFQAIELWDDLTVGENVGVGASNRIAPSPSDIDDILGLLGIAALRDRPAGELSQGQRQLVSIARSLLGRPKVLLLDEPAAGLDTNESLWLGDKLRAVRDRGVTVLLIDHDMGLVLSLCDEIRVLNFGVLIASGTPESVRADAVVSEAYLGSTHSRLVATPTGPGDVDRDGEVERVQEVASPAPSKRASE